MKLLTLLLVSTLFIKSSSFYDAVFNSFGRHSYYVGFDVSSPGYKGPVIIENSDLFEFISRTEKNITTTSYGAEMERFLKSELPLSIKDTTFFRRAIKVDVDSAVKENTLKGVDDFLKLYFNGGVLKASVTDKERETIIYALFMVETACRIDDESGYLVYTRFD